MGENEKICSKYCMLYVAILQLQIYICSQIVFRLVGPQYWWCVLGWSTMCVSSPGGGRAVQALCQV